MRAGLLLRITLYGFGLYALHGALVYGVYYLHRLFRSPVWPFDNAGDPNPIATLFGYSLAPLLFALACFGFAGAIERFLLGAAANERLECTEASAHACLRIGTKLVGLYLLATYSPPFVTTIAQFIMIKAADAFDPAQTGSDFIYNALGLLIGYYLCTRTESVVRVIVAAEKRPR